MFSCRLVSQKRGPTYAAAKLAGDPKLSINPRKEYDFGEALRHISNPAKSAAQQRTKYPGEEQTRRLERQSQGVSRKTRTHLWGV